MPRLERTFKVFGNRRRLMILQLLLRGKPLTVADIADEIKLSFTSTSKHLRLLDHAGIVEPELVGRYVYYRLAKPNSATLKSLMTIVAHSPRHTIPSPRHATGQVRRDLLKREISN